MTKKAAEENTTYDSMADLVKSINKGKGAGLSPVGLQRSAFVADAISSGSLVFDLITGGGIPPGRIVSIFGPEGGGKSTFCYNVAKSSIQQDIPVFYYDAEGASDPAYMARIGLDLDLICGNVKGKEQVFFYYQPSTGEEVYRHIKKVLDRLPDCESGKIQALFIIDSLVAMLPEAMEEDPDKNPMGAQARMHSAFLPLIVSKLAQKQCTLLYTNQLRNKIGMQYGNPETEPGGEAPKFYSSMRVRVSCVSFGHGGAYLPTSDKGAIYEEKNVKGEGMDRYRLMSLGTIKNKSFSPFRNSHVRIWFEEAGSPGRGIDIVHDTWSYLCETGQAYKDGGRLKLRLPGWEDKSFFWQDFKELILAERKRLPFLAMECGAQILPPDAIQELDTILGTGKKVKEVLKKSKARGVVKDLVAEVELKPKKKKLSLVSETPIKETTMVSAEMTPTTDEPTDEQKKASLRLIKAKATGIWDIRGYCQEQLKEGTAFHLYYEAISTKKVTKSEG